MLKKLKQLWRSSYVRLLEDDVSRLRGENRALMNSLLGTAGFPPVELTVTPPAAPVGALAWRPYRNGVLANLSTCSKTLTFSQTFVDTFSFTCGNPSNNAITTSTSISSSGLAGPQLILVGGRFTNTLSGTFTANRAAALPDNTGIV